LLVLDDENFARVARNSSNFGGNSSLNKPNLIIHFEHKLFGPGINFSLISDKQLTRR
jgi:hypothetical protein